MCYFISALNCVMLRLKENDKPHPLSIKWLKYAYGPLSLLSLTSFLPPFINYTSDYTACMIFPVLLFTLFGVLLSYGTKDSRPHRLFIQACLNLYIFRYVWVFEYMHDRINLTSFLTTFFITIFWNGTLTEILIIRNREYETQRHQAFKQIKKFELYQQQYREYTGQLLSSKTKLL